MTVQSDDKRLERWVTCRTCSALMLIPARVRVPPVFRARCVECKAEGVYTRTDVFERPQRTH